MSVTLMMIDRPTVMKFGGTSVEDADAFARVARIVRAHESERPVVVVSAMSRVTDALLAAVQKAADGSAAQAAGALDEHFARYLSVAHTLLTADSPAIVTTIETSRREITELLQTVASGRVSRPLLQDVIVSYGERLSAMLLAAVLRENGLAARYVDARRCIVTNDEHGCATPIPEATGRRTRAELQHLVEGGEVPVLGGFIGVNTGGETTTLGRGGSDYTAALVGVALMAREIQIWTDVSGVLTADPRIVKTARTISRLSYAEAAELSYFGAKVIHPKTIQPAVEEQIPVRICNSRTTEAAGTIICAESEATPHTVKAIAHKTGVTILQITSLRRLGAHGFLRALFEIFERHQTVVDIVAISEVSVSLSLNDIRSRPSIVKELQQIGAVEVKSNCALVCIVGAGLRDAAGVVARVFSAIGEVPISLISQGASSLNLTFVVDESLAREVIKRLHATFFEGPQAQDAKIEDDSHKFYAKV